MCMIICYVISYANVMINGMFLRLLRLRIVIIMIIIIITVITICPIIISVIIRYMK